MVDLPFGRGKKLAGNAGGFLHRVIGGWQIAGSAGLRSHYWSLPDEQLGPVGDIEIYGKKYPIEDCRSGTLLSRLPLLQRLHPGATGSTATTRRAGRTA